MKTILGIIRTNILWIGLLLLTDLFISILLWVTDVRALGAISLSLFSFTIIGLAVVIFRSFVAERRLEKAFADLLDSPDETNAREVIRAMGPLSSERVASLTSRLLRDNAAINDLNIKMDDYEEYVESWAHEAKTPLALLTLLLDNHKGELTPDLSYKIEYIRSRLSEYVEQMLQFARIRGSRKDYLFERIRISDIVTDVLEDYGPLLEEKGFLVINRLQSETCYCDKRSLRYMLGQFVSNSIKYSSEDPELRFEFDSGVLSITDNGIGVKASDMPYIFERGFTGDTGDFRTKATGMGLYLASKVAEDMNLKVSAKSPEDGGLTIEVTMPDVK